MNITLVGLGIGLSNTTFDPDQSDSWAPLFRPASVSKNSRVIFVLPVYHTYAPIYDAHMGHGDCTHWKEGPYMFQPVLARLLLLVRHKFGFHLNVSKYRA